MQTLVKKNLVTWYPFPMGAAGRNMTFVLLWTFHLFLSKTSFWKLMPHSNPLHGGQFLSKKTGSSTKPFFARNYMRYWIEVCTKIMYGTPTPVLSEGKFSKIHNFCADLDISCNSKFIVLVFDPNSPYPPNGVVA